MTRLFLFVVCNKVSSSCLLVLYLHPSHGLLSETMYFSQYPPYSIWFCCQNYTLLISCSMQISYNTWLGKQYKIFILTSASHFTSLEQKHKFYTQNEHGTKEKKWKGERVGRRGRDILFSYKGIITSWWVQKELYYITLWFSNQQTTLHDCFTFLIARGDVGLLPYCPKPSHATFTENNIYFPWKLRADDRSSIQKDQLVSCPREACKYYRL